jgi:hypothetical protein
MGDRTNAIAVVAPVYNPKEKVIPSNKEMALIMVVRNRYAPNPLLVMRIWAIATAELVLNSFRTAVPVNSSSPLGLAHRFLFTVTERLYLLLEGLFDFLFFITIKLAQAFFDHVNLFFQTALIEFSF